MSLGTRVVDIQIDPGNDFLCAHCGERVKFIARAERALKRQVIVNVYVGARWDHIESFHLACYAEAEEPFGAITERKHPGHHLQATA